MLSPVRKLNFFVISLLVKEQKEVALHAQTSPIDSRKELRVQVHDYCSDTHNLLIGALQRWLAVSCPSPSDDKEILKAYRKLK